MSKHIIALILFTFCVRANASKWIFMGASESETSYLDKDSIAYVSTNNTHLKAWIKENYKKKTEPAIQNKQGKVLTYYEGKMTLIEFDCVNNKLGIIQAVDYLDNGTTKTNNNYSGVEDFIPDTFGEIWLKTACNLWLKRPVITYTNPDGTTSQTYLPSH